MHPDALANWDQTQSLNNGVQAPPLVHIPCVEQSEWPIHVIGGRSVDEEPLRRHATIDHFRRWSFKSGLLMLKAPERTDKAEVSRRYPKHARRYSAPLH